LKKRRTEMFVTVSTYRAKAGEEDAIIALHEDWQRNIQPRVKGYLSGELLRKAEAPREFISIMRFESQESARALTNDPEQDAWYRRVVSLTENVPVLIEYTSEWP
jgi:heme-degrading monooxygenase HmoA